MTELFSSYEQFAEKKIKTLTAENRRLREALEYVARNMHCPVVGCKDNCVWHIAMKALCLSSSLDIKPSIEELKDQVMKDFINVRRRLNNLDEQWGEFHDSHRFIVQDILRTEFKALDSALNEKLTDHKDSCAWVHTIYARCDCGFKEKDLGKVDCEIHEKD